MDVFDCLDRWFAAVGATLRVAKGLSRALHHCGLAMVLAIATPALAQPPGPGERLLKSFLSDVTTLRADFVQTLVDEDRRELQESSGTLAIRRPGRFRWNYTLPAEQVIVADGTHLWLYDPELDQVSVRRLDQTLAPTPAMLLSGDGDVNAHSDISELGEAGGMTWVELTPKEGDSDFDRVRIGFSGRDIAVMELVDGFGQTTRIEFNNLVRNPDIGRDVFEFEPPPGADVIGPDD